jgi:hypothetical protein
LLAIIKMGRIGALMRITREQQNQLADLARNSGLSVDDFEKSAEVAKLKVQYRHDYFSFSIERQQRDVYLISILPVDRTNPANLKVAWTQVRTYFDAWVKAVAAEVTTPDAWESIESSDFYRASDLDYSESYSEDEQVIIRNQMKVLAESIASLQLSSGQQQIVLQRLDSITAQLGKLSRFDWRSLLLGTIMNLAFALAFTPDVVQAIRELVIKAFAKWRLLP